MNKNIIICADGTSNRPEQNENDHPTNILRIARAISPVSEMGHPQQVFYDWGIGSYHNSIPAAITGRGLEKNITDAYRYIIHNYSPGDRLYLFGFSRGAYTIRALAALINTSGILKQQHAHLIPEAYRHYKQPHPFTKTFGKLYTHPCRQIRFIGAFDTVGALGVPIPRLQKRHQFHHTQPPQNITTLRLALAIDEHRIHFRPTLWQEHPGLDLQQT